jgi:hypothetical protein
MAPEGTATAACISASPGSSEQAPIAMRIPESSRIFDPQRNMSSCPAWCEAGRLFAAADHWAHPDFRL